MANDGDNKPDPPQINVQVKREAEEEANNFKSKLTGKLAEKLDFAFVKLFEPNPDMPQPRVDMLLGQLARKNQLKFEVCQKFYEYRISGKTKGETVDLLNEQGLCSIKSTTKSSLTKKEQSQNENYVEQLINPPDWTESLIQAVEEAVLAETVPDKEVSENTQKIIDDLKKELREKEEKLKEKRKSVGKSVEKTKSQ